MSLEPVTRQAAAARLLVCLDLRERIGPTVPRGARPAWQARARLLLAHARKAAWPIAHLLIGYPTAEACRWKAIEGLSPTPSEPVFYVDPAEGPPSAAFLRFAGYYGEAELLFMGNAAANQRLDRLALAFKDRELAVAADAVAALPKISGLRLAAVRGLVGGAPELRLIPGGRIEDARS